MEYMHNINNFAEVTFETKCWENDWKLMLKTEHLKRMIDNCNYQFANKVLFINNVDHYEKVGKYALRAKNRGIINAYYNVKDYAEEVLKYFDLSREAFFFGGGYYYSIAELVSIYLCKTKYLLHFSSDSYIASDVSNENWILNAINIMEKDEDIIVANPTWNYRWNEAKSEADDENKLFWIGHFLINVI